MSSRTPTRSCRRQFLVGSRVFDANQRLAGDTTGNGTVSSLDATRIQEYLVGNLAWLPVALNCASDWAFVPVPGPQGNPTPIAPHVTVPCTVGGISYSSVTGGVSGQDFQGILFGDVTGSWTPPGGGSEGIRALEAASDSANKSP